MGPPSSPGAVQSFATTKSDAMPNSVLEPTPIASFSPSAPIVRHWSAPGAILAVTNFADEEILLFHSIQQARRSVAKVILVHVLQAKDALPDSRDCSKSIEPGCVTESALASLNRMAQQLRWVGIPCEPLLLRGAPAKEITLAAKAHGADRILMSAAYEERAQQSALKTLAEELLPGISVPICTLGPGLPPSPAGNGQIGRITLALSLHSNPEMPLAFASRLAHEHKLRLTVIHVSGPHDKGRAALTPLTFASQLPADTLRDAELLCQLQILVRKGDPATEILNSGSCTSQDFIVLGPVGQPPLVPVGRSSVVHRVINEAPCPVMLLGPSVGGPTHG